MKKVIVFVVMMLAASAWADPGNIYLGTGNWNDVANWSDGTIPTVIDNVIIYNDAAVTIDSGANFAGCLRVGGRDFDNVITSNGTLNMTGGTLTTGSNGFFVGMGYPSIGYVNLSGGTITATAGWGNLGRRGSVYWNQTGGSFTQFTNGLATANAGQVIDVRFNITGGDMTLNYAPNIQGAGTITMVMTVGGTAVVTLDDVGVLAGAASTNSATYVLNPGGKIRVWDNNASKLPALLVAPGGYEVSHELPYYTVYTGTPEPITLAILGLGGLFIRRRG